MAIAFVKSIADGTEATSGQTFNIPLAANASAGNLVIMGLYSEEAAAVGVSDSNGNTWSKAAEINVPTTYGASQIWWTSQAAGALGTTDTITVDHGTTFDRPNNWNVSEFSGLALVSPFDVSGSANSTIAGQALTASAPTTTANELVYVWVDFMGDNATTGALDALLTPIGTPQNSGAASIAFHHTYAGYRILSATGTPTYTNTRTGGAKTLALMATFKISGSGATVVKAGLGIVGP